jgi:hypothetical protein
MLDLFEVQFGSPLGDDASGAKRPVTRQSLRAG